MNRDLFWLSDEQFARILSHLPQNTLGKPRVDAPADYDPRKTLHNWYVRWAAQGVCYQIFHALTDAACRAIAFVLTGGQVADYKADSVLLKRLPSCHILHADKGYDTNHIRRTVEAGGHDAQHHAQSEPDLEKLLLALPLSRPQRHRALVLPTE